MQIKKVKNISDGVRNVEQTFENKKGLFEYKATLTDDEVKFVMEIGLNVLYAHGSIPFTTHSAGEIAPTTKTMQ